MGWQHYLQMIWAWIVILTENALHAFYPVMCVVVITLSALYTDASETIRFVVFMLGFMLGMFLFIRRAKHFQCPKHNQILRRIEKDNTLEHRPLSAQKDHFIQRDTPQTARLAAMHKLSTHPAHYQTRGIKPKPIITSRDPYGLRFIAILALVAVFIVSGFQMPRPLVFPTVIDFEPAETVSPFTLTIKPPGYTGIDAFQLSHSDPNIDIPVGSELTALIHSTWRKPKLLINDVIIDMQETEEVFTATTNMPNNAHTVTLKRFLKPEFAWTVSVTPDKAPVLSFQDDHAVLPDGTIRIPMIGFDDYGVATLTLKMNIDTDIDVPPIGEPLTLERSVLTKPAEPYEFAPVFDLTAHPWAGLPVSFEITGYDALRQASETETINIILPEKPFQHPIAKDLIRMRKKLAWDTKKTDIGIIRGLNTYLRTPEKYAHDPVIYLGLRAAASRLLWSSAGKDRAKAVMDLLWDLAVAIEDGDLNLAKQKVRMAQNALEQAMRDPNATPDDISKAMDDLRGAMKQMMAEMMREMAKDGAPALPPETFDTIIGSDTIDDLIAQMEEALRNGDTAKANDMMAQLQDLMDQLQSSQMAEMPADMEMMERGENALKELVDKQQQLRDQTARQAGQYETGFGKILPFNQDTMNDLGMSDMPPVPDQPAAPNAAQTTNTQAKRAEQEALRIILGQLMLDAANVLDDIPEGMGLAEQEMRGSSSALGENQPAQSLPHQDQAIAYLKQAQQSLSQQLQRRMKQMGAMGLSQGRGGQGMQYDPLGRPYQEGEESENGLPGSTVEIPDEAERKRAYEIMKDLRERSSDRTQSREALEYFQRLLKRF